MVLIFMFDGFVAGLCWMFYFGLCLLNMVIFIKVGWVCNYIFISVVYLFVFYFYICTASAF